MNGERHLSPVHQATDRQAPPETGWRLLDHFVLRRPGFPFEWLHRLRFPDSVAAARRLLAARSNQDRLRQTFVEDVFPRVCSGAQTAGGDRATFRFWYRLAREVRAGRALDAASIEQITTVNGHPELGDWLAEWQTACAAVAQLTRAGESIFEVELVERRRALRSLGNVPGVQEALWLSNPAMYEVGWRYLMKHWEPGRRPSKVKHVERRLYSYLQRLCGKNDTTSFFGPLDYGAFETDEAGFAPMDVRCRVGREPIRARRVFFAYWAASALGERIAADPSIRPHLRPRHDPLRPGPADAFDARLYTLADGTRSIADLAQALRVPRAAIATAVDRLEAEAILHVDLAIPPACLDPLRFLAERVHALPTVCAGRQHWADALAELEGECERFATADFDSRRALLERLEQRYSELVDQPARRGNGQMFQDRTLVYEECRGNVEELRLGEAHRQKLLRALGPMARLCQAMAEAARADQRERAMALFDLLSRDGRPIRFVDLLVAWRRNPRPPGSPRATRLLHQFAELVTRCQHDGLSALSADDVTALCPLAVDSGLLSPDVLIAARDVDAIRDGQYQIILGEIHHGIQPVGWMLAFADDPAVWEKQLVSCVPAPTADLTAANIIFGRRMKTAPPEFPGLSVEASGTSTRPDRSIELGALTVERCAGELRLRARGESPALRFYPPSFGVPAELFAPFACFAYPLVESITVCLGEHTPRIEIEGAVFQRERWDVAASSVPGRDRLPESGFQLLVDGISFQERLGMPEQVFLRTPAELKPVLVDFHNFFALELLAHLAGAVEHLTFSEMLPTPDQLWLEDERGRYCAELRTVVVCADTSSHGCRSE